MLNGVFVLNEMRRKGVCILKNEREIPEKSGKNEILLSISSVISQYCEKESIMICFDIVLKL